MSVEDKLDTIIENQEKILEKQDELKAEEDEVLQLEEKELEKDEQLHEDKEKQDHELEEIEALEEEILQDVEDHPLKKITYRDITKGLIGAFFGIVGHFAFAKGVSLADKISMPRAHFLYLSSFIIVILFLYFSGFRKVNDTMLFKILPVRALVIYVTALIAIVIVLTLYGHLTVSMTFTEIYKTIATISVLAVMGAGTADLIGENPE